MSFDNDYIRCPWCEEYDVEEVDYNFGELCYNCREYTVPDKESDELYYDENEGEI